MVRDGDIPAQVQVKDVNRKPKFSSPSTSTGGQTGHSVQKKAKSGPPFWAPEGGKSTKTQASQAKSVPSSKNKSSKKRKADISK